MTIVLPVETATAAATSAGIEPDVLQPAVDIALQGGPDEATPDWLQWRSCRDAEPGDYYPERGQRTDGLLDRCRRDCAVQAECLAAALTNGERHGIWGGTSAVGRKRLRVKLREAGLLGVTGEEAYIAWRDEHADREPAPLPERPPVSEPWPHQRKAVAAIVDELRDGGTCQIAMATASGKTHVALWAAHDLHAGRVLILVPSLSLITQTATTWASDQRWGHTPMLAVCSDTGGTGGIEATTDPGRVRDFLEVNHSAVVLATYQSSDVLTAAGLRFDLIVADEAHHLAGDADKHYAAVARGEIPTDRTLYMTATPRRYLRRRTGTDDVQLVSMDDETAFGPRVFTFNLSDAVDAGVIADYRVIVAAVERHVFDQVAAHPDMVDVDPHLLAGAIAVVDAMGDLDLTSCVSFHTRVERARSFSRLVGQVAELLPAIRPPQPGWAGYLHGGASVRIRERLLHRLADPHTWGVVANAKALGEGIDLPTLDAVAIVDPKNSETDVLQATGRALRLSGDKVGTVLLPVLLAAGADPADPMSALDERSLDVVSGVLRALRAHDSALATRLDRTRRAISRSRQGAAPELGQVLRQRAARNLLQSRVEMRLPGGPLGDLAGAMALHLVRETTASWDEAYGRLQDWTAQHGHCRIPQSADVPVVAGAKTSLGSWCSRQRSLHARGLLAAERVAALEALPGWMWNARDEAWWERFDRLAEFVETHGRYPQGRETWRGDSIGSFVNTCRTAKTVKDNEWLLKFPDRMAALEALPGWVWNARDAAWEEHYQQLRTWAAEHGHAQPSAGDLTPDGFDLGKWVAKERQKIRNGKRTPHQVARLRALPGWVDDYRQVSDALWEDGYRRLARHIDQHRALPAQGHIEPDGHRLGAWLLKQRQAHLHDHRRGVLTPERVARLEALPHWSWTPHHDAWRRTYDLLARIAPERIGPDGHIVIPTERVEDVDVDSWAYWQRKNHRDGTLAPGRAALLEQIPGWTWEPSPGRRLPTAPVERRCDDCGRHHATVAEALACDDQLDLPEAV